MSKVGRHESAREAEAGEGLASIADRVVATNDESPQAKVRRGYASDFSGNLSVVCSFVFLTTYYFPTMLFLYSI